MPAMYPEQLRSLREQNPGLQYDFRGNVVGTNGSWLEQQMRDLFYKPDYDASQPSWNQLYQNYGPANGDALSRAVAGLDGYNYQNDQFVGPVLPGQQQGYRYSDYDQAGPLQPGVSNLSLPNVGFYSQWNPDTNSWVRHGAPSDAYRQPGSGRTTRPQNPYVGQQTPDARNMRPPALHAGAADILADAAENKWGVNPLQPYTYAYRGYGAQYPFDHDDGSGEFTPGGY